jgi:hypothetical protein
MVDQASYQQSQTLDFLVTDLDRLKELATAHDFKLVIFVFPYEYQLRRNAIDTSSPQALITKAGRKSGVIVYDLADELRGYLARDDVTPKALFLFNDPMHFSEQGHCVVADVIYARLTIEGILGGVR